MLNIAYTESEQRLLEAADIAERNEEYNQGTFKNLCGTPGCMLGGYAAAHPESWAFGAGGTPFRRGVVCKVTRLLHPTVESALWEFDLNIKEYDDIFSGFGCGDAGSDGKAAAKWLRNWVYEHAKARIAA